MLSITYRASREQGLKDIGGFADLKREASHVELKVYAHNKTG